MNPVEQNNDMQGNQAWKKWTWIVVGKRSGTNSKCLSPRPSTIQSLGNLLNGKDIINQGGFRTECRRSNLDNLPYIEVIKVWKVLL